MSGSTKSAVSGLSTPGRKNASDCSRASPTGALSNTPPSTNRRMQIFRARPPCAADCAWHESPVSGVPWGPGQVPSGASGSVPHEVAHSQSTRGRKASGKAADARHD